MAWFQFGKKTDASPGSARMQAPTQTVEAMRQRAKHRLIGSAALVLLGVVGFPLLFDSQPRPVAVDIAIEIPDKAKTKPLAIPGAQVAAPAVAPSSTKIEAAASLGAKEEILPPVANKTEPKALVAGVDIAKSAIKTEADTALAKKAAADKIAAKKAEADKATADKIQADQDKAEKRRAAEQKDTEAARAKALLEGKPAAANTAPANNAAASSPAAAEGRFVVQFGAFTDAAKAREARLKVEKTGMKTYTQVAEVEGGKRIRVRVGPFASRAEADKAAAKIKSLDLPAAVLTL